MGSSLDMLKLVLEASLPVQIVMALLLGASVWSWWIIFRKKSTLEGAQKEATQFEERFWSGADLAQLYKEVSGGKNANQGVAGIFEAGFREFARMRQRTRADARSMLEGAHRGMRVALTREVDRLEHNVNNLATIGSISPYVGLFGTVWGIMIAFHALGGDAAKGATIATVAPAISEALIATAMGLFAAIPAVVFYNRFSHAVDRLETRYDTFADEFMSILQRQAHLDEH
jgi:biopolymer transport protein TolQ